VSLVSMSGGEYFCGFYVLESTKTPETVVHR
jgi:hypothetical protein